MMKMKKKKIKKITIIKILKKQFLKIHQKIKNQKKQLIKKEKNY